MSLLRRGWSWSVDQYKRVLSYAYYECLFGTQSRLSEGLARRVATWEQERGKGDVPIPRTLLEQQYESGHWDFLRGLGELGRFSVVVGYVNALAADGALLDVGCGEGLLFRRLQRGNGSRYLGLDLSATAVAKASQGGAGPFVCADAESYVPTDTFDAIVFNECLYYFTDPLATVARYFAALRPNGIVIVSTYARSRRARSILRALKRRYVLFDETAVSHDANSWICSVLSTGNGAADPTHGRSVRL
jgi:2-polyprenyl-3-methyl-5-hydroxy-6-metoxy-1,4-benzoquinol methylase